MEFMDEGSSSVAKDALHNYKLDGENKIKVCCLLFTRPAVTECLCFVRLLSQESSRCHVFILCTYFRISIIGPMLRNCKVLCCRLSYRLVDHFPFVMPANNSFTSSETPQEFWYPADLYNGVCVKFTVHKLVMLFTQTHSSEQPCTLSFSSSLGSRLQQEPARLQVVARRLPLRPVVLPSVPAAGPHCD